MDLRDRNKIRVVRKSDADDVCRIWILASTLTKVRESCTVAAFGGLQCKVGNVKLIRVSDINPEKVGAHLRTESAWEGGAT